MVETPLRSIKAPETKAGIKEPLRCLRREFEVMDDAITSEAAAIFVAIGGVGPYAETERGGADESPR